MVPKKGLRKQKGQRADVGHSPHITRVASWESICIFSVALGSKLEPPPTNQGFPGALGHGMALVVDQV